MPKTRLQSRTKKRTQTKPYSKPVSLNPCRTNFVEDLDSSTGDAFPVNNCFLEGISLDMNPEWERIKNDLEKVKDKLPVYLINGHSAIELIVHLKKPKSIIKKFTNTLKQYEENKELGKLLKEGYSVHSIKKDTRPDAFKMTNGEIISEDSWRPFVKMPKDTYYIGLSPIGLDSMCGDNILLDTINSMTGDKEVKKFRQKIFSENFQEIFAHPQSTRNIAWIPPGCEYINRGFQFFDVTDGLTYEKYGIYNMDTLKSPIKLDEPITVTDIQHQVTLLHPDTMLKDYISKQITLDDDNICLKTIIEKLGPGIYIDIGCSPLSIRPILRATEWSRIVDEERPIPVENTKELYEVIYQSIDELRRKGTLTWNNIVMSDKEFHGERGLIRSALEESSRTIQAPLQILSSTAFQTHQTRAQPFITASPMVSPDESSPIQETHEQFLTRRKSELGLARGLKKTKKKKKRQRKKSKKKKGKGKKSKKKKGKATRRK